MWIMEKSTHNPEPVEYNVLHPLPFKTSCLTPLALQNQTNTPPHEVLVCGFDDMTWFKWYHFVYLFCDITVSKIYIILHTYW